MRCDDPIPEAQGGAIRSLAAPGRAHFVGVAGSGMRSLAGVLHAAGWHISGSDLAPWSLDCVPFDVSRGHDAATIDQAIDLVVYSNAVSSTNCELSRARQLGIPTLSYPEMLGRLMQSRAGVAIAGTHGKSTATAMTGEILTAAGLDPTVVVGAAPVEGSSGSRYGRGSRAVVEACEYRAAFCHLEPEIAVILNIESDHFDSFATPKQLEEAFAQFAHKVPAEGLVLALDECAATRRVCTKLTSRRETFGFSPHATWQAVNLRQHRGYYWFQLSCQWRVLCEVKLRVPGRHNVLCALAAAAVASHCGASGQAIGQGLARFAGLRRRLQPLGEMHGVTLVDDYAHHPTEVAASLATLRQMCPNRRLWCVFEPHQGSRLACLLDEFAGSLQHADKVIVADVFRAREQPAAGAITAGHLSRRAAALGGDVVQLASTAEIRDHLKLALRPGDVLVTMGAGNIAKVAHELGQRLRTFRQAG